MLFLLLIISLKCFSEYKQKWQQWDEKGCRPQSLTVFCNQNIIYYIREKQPLPCLFDAMFKNKTKQNTWLMSVMFPQDLHVMFWSGTLSSFCRMLSKFSCRITFSDTTVKLMFTGLHDIGEKKTKNYKIFFFFPPPLWHILGCERDKRFQQIKAICYACTVTKVILIILVTLKVHPLLPPPLLFQHYNHAFTSNLHIWLILTGENRLRGI